MNFFLCDSFVLFAPLWFNTLFSTQRSVERF